MSAAPQARRGIAAAARTSLDKSSLNMDNIVRVMMGKKKDQLAQIIKVYEKTFRVISVEPKHNIGYTVLDGKPYHVIHKKVELVHPGQSDI
jgi:predicted protein tyrosine phosphatase